MKGATYCLETFGCQMNVLDSQLVEGQLRQRGMRPVGDPDQAVVILFNPRSGNTPRTRCSAGSALCGG